MEIYIASFAGLLSSLLLAVVYLADRYEPEPIELIQDSFLTGLVGQLVLIFAVSSLTGGCSGRVGGWSSPLSPQRSSAVSAPPASEMDERFDGIVYSVALAGGATCAIHLNNLPRVMAASPYRDALAPGAEPDLRDLLILAGSPGFTAELGRGLVMIFAAVLVGCCPRHPAAAGLAAVADGAGLPRRGLGRRRDAICWPAAIGGCGAG